MSEKIDFEKLFKELEEIVEKMESGDLTLQESLELFEKGMKISKILKKELDSIEHKVEILLKDESGNIRKEEFDREIEES